MAERISELRTIVIPRQYTSFSEDAKIDVVPLNDQWLTSPERTWEEVDAFLEEQLQAIQGSFEFSTEPTPRARNYGLRKPIGRSASRLLAYAELMDEYRTIQEGAGNAATAVRNQYEDEKARIKQAKLSQGKTRQRLDTLWRGEYNPRIQTTTSRSQEAQKIQQLILRKAVMDTFSIPTTPDTNNDPLITASFPALLDTLKNSFAENQYSTNEQFRERAPINYLIDALGSYLTSTGDRSLFFRSRYRETSSLVTLQKDCRILEVVLSIGANHSLLGISSETANQLERLSRQYLTFLGNRAVKLSQISSPEKYPQLSLIYDLSSAALYSGKPSIVAKLGQYLDVAFRDNPSRPQFRDEFTQCVEQFSKVSQPVYIYLGAFPKILKMDASSPSTINFDNPPQYLFDLLQTEEWRLIEGLFSLETLIQDHSTSLPGPRSSTLKAISNHLERTVPFSSIPDFSPFLLTKDISSFLLQLPKTVIYPKLGIEVTLASFAHGRFSYVPGAESRGKSDSLKFLSKSLAGLDPITFQREALNRYLPTFWETDTEKTKQIDRENQFLWDEVLNNPTWFISPRGDRYTYKGDPQLTEYGIHSVTLYADRRYPREHQVTVRLENVDQPLILWLNTSQKLLSSDRQILFTNPSLEAAFTNFLLKRLYFITSGLLSQEPEPRVGEGDSLVLAYRRAFYRYLTSTIGRPITMESHGAQVHAQEVLEDYGIDIFAEIRRRRAIGTLRPDQYLTFVREVIPRIVSVIVMPNDLKYRPELVQIPIR